MEKSAIFTTRDGSHSVFSEKYGADYHSRFGAIRETQHVFIQAALHFKAESKQDLSILEVGFGTGLNAYATFFEAEKKKLNVSYFAVDAYPLDISTIITLNYPSFFNSNEFQPLFLKLHEIPWNVPAFLSEYFQIEKRLSKIEDLELSQQFDLIYFDAFAPDVQPELWTDAMMAKMYSLLIDGGVLVTYCAKGSVKRSLKKAGFFVEALPGPPGKREMTRAMKMP